MRTSTQNAARLTPCVLALIACLCLAMSLPGQAQSADELTEDQIKYDADVKSQVGKVGAYQLRVGALPYRLFVESLDLLDALKDPGQARKSTKKYTWLNPAKGKKFYSYEVWASKKYNPELPAGVIVFINSGNKGTLKKSYRNLLASKNLIVIGANQSGNEIDTAIRLTLAFYAVELMKRRYAIDTERVYITGNSGGGRIASHAMFYRPDIFKAGLPMIGCMAPIANGNTAFDLGVPQMHSMPSNKAMRQAAKFGRYVFLTGEKDFNRKECEATAKYLNSKGFSFATAMVQPGLGHASVSPKYFGKALNFIDKPLIDLAAKQFQKAESDRQRGRLEDALTGYQQARSWLHLSAKDADKAIAKQAKTQVNALNKQYEDALAAVDQAIEAKDADAATLALRDLQKGWRVRLGRAALAEYRKKITEVKRGG